MNKTATIYYQLKQSSASGPETLTTTKVTMSVYPEFTISGGTTTINDGDTTPKSADSNQFGNMDIDLGTETNYNSQNKHLR